MTSAAVENEPDVELHNSFRGLVHPIILRQRGLQCGYGNHAAGFDNVRQKIFWLDTLMSRAENRVHP